MIRTEPTDQRYFIKLPSSEANPNILDLEHSRKSIHWPSAVWGYLWGLPTLVPATAFVIWLWQR